MGKYLLKRLINYMIMFFVAVTLAYFLAASRLDPLLLYDITNPNLDWDSINASLSDKNLNPSEPLLSRYWDWLTGVVHGDWGEKPKSGSVNDEIANRVPGELPARHRRLPHRRDQRHPHRRLDGDEAVQVSGPAPSRCGHSS